MAIISVRSSRGICSLAQWGAVWFACIAVCFAADQTRIGEGNAAAAALAGKSSAVQSAKALILKQAAQIQDVKLRQATLDALTASTCIAHRAGLDAAKKRVIADALIAADLADASEVLVGGVFPPVRNEESSCPTLPQPFDSAPGSSFGGHHSYPGGLAIHESFNLLSGLSYAQLYESVYGPGPYFSRDILIAAPIWHDWAKAIVFQWNADGTEFGELSFGGSAKVDSKTPAHHILGLAETMKRGLDADLIIAQASAHAAPVLGSEYKVVNWIRAAAIIARLDPVAAGYLVHGASAREMRLARHLPEDSIHNLSDADFVFSIPAVAQAEALLKQFAGEFGYEAGRADYNVRFRNPALSHLTAERMVLMGAQGVLQELRKLRASKII